ncbi:Uncharacterised protein [Klebsiella pneumoniae]|uniref:Uncharacterized protein n=1 Tax=Klebsiella pneumoniae TaxID=573 RepID=A0A377TGA5_KLEPN|nr:Uncharacterised protein [Klebsiella pneumoniae]
MVNVGKPTTGRHYRYITREEPLNSRTLLIGASYDTSEFINDIGISAVLIYNNDIGRTNITTVMNWLRNVVGVEAGIWSAPKSS